MCVCVYKTANNTQDSGKIEVAMLVQNLLYFK